MSLSLSGGWSTYQVKPQQRLAIKIRNAVMTNRYDQVANEKD